MNKDFEIISKALELCGIKASKYGYHTISVWAVTRDLPKKIYSKITVHSDKNQEFLKKSIVCIDNAVLAAVDGDSENCEKEVKLWQKYLLKLVFRLSEQDRNMFKKTTSTSFS